MSSCWCEIRLLGPGHSGSGGDFGTGREESEQYLFSSNRSSSDSETASKLNELARVGGLHRERWRINIRERTQTRRETGNLARIKLNDRYDRQDRYCHDSCLNSQVDYQHHRQHCQQGRRVCLMRRHYYYLLNKPISTTTTTTTTSLLIISLLLISSLSPQQATSVGSKTKPSFVLLTTNNSNSIRQSDHEREGQVELSTRSREKYIKFLNFGGVEHVDDNNGRQEPALPPVVLANNNLRTAHVGDKIGIASNNDKNSNKIDKREKNGPRTAAAAASSSAVNKTGASYANEQLSSNDQFKQPQKQPSFGQRRARRSSAILEQRTSAPACNDCLAIPLVAIVGRKQVNGFIIQPAASLHSRHRQRHQQTLSLQSEASRRRSESEQQHQQHREYTHKTTGSRDKQQQEKQGHSLSVRQQQQQQIGNQPTIYAPEPKLRNNQIKQSAHESSRSVYDQHQQVNTYPSSYPSNNQNYQQRQQYSILEPKSDERCTLTVCDQIDSYPTDVIFNKLEHAKRLFGQTYFNFDSFFSDESHFSSEPFEDMVDVQTIKPDAVRKHSPTAQRIESQHFVADDNINANISAFYGHHHMGVSAGSATDHRASINEPTANTTTYATKSSSPIKANGSSGGGSARGGDDDGQAAVSTGVVGGENSHSRHKDAMPLVYHGDKSQIMRPSQRRTQCCGSQMAPRRKLDTAVAKLNDRMVVQESNTTRGSDQNGSTMRAGAMLLLNNTNPLKKAESSVQHEQKQQQQQQRPLSAREPEDFLYLVERRGIRIPDAASYNRGDIISSGVDDYDTVRANSSSGDLKGSTTLSRNKRQPYRQTMELHPNGASSRNVDDDDAGDKDESKVDADFATTDNNNNYDDHQTASANYTRPAAAAATRAAPSPSVKLATNKIATDSSPLPARYGQLEAVLDSEQITTNAKVILATMASTLSNSRTLDDKTVKTNGKLGRVSSGGGDGNGTIEPLLFTRHRGGGRFPVPGQNASIIYTIASVSQPNAHASLRTDTTQKRRPPDINKTVESAGGKLLTPAPSSSLSLDRKNVDNNNNNRSNGSVNNIFQLFVRHSLGDEKKSVFKYNTRDRSRRQVPVLEGDTNGSSVGGGNDQGSDSGTVEGQDASSSGEQIQPICRARSIYISPRAALNDKKQWKYIVNTPERDPRVRQIIRVDVCENPFEPCSAQITLPLGFTSQCKQKYAKKKLLALDSQGGALEVDTFFIPSCCVCQLILDTGSDGSSPLAPPIDVETAPLVDKNDAEPQASPDPDSA